MHDDVGAHGMRPNVAPPISLYRGSDGAAKGKAHGRAPLHRPAKSLGAFIAGFKSACTKRINEIRSTPGLPVWQRNYYERIIRNETELNAIREYIISNPAKWQEDEENPNSHP